MSDWYLLIGIFVYGLFLCQFIISCIAGDFNIDADVDGSADFDLGDVVSFKGATHFLMGFTGWTSTKQLLGYQVTWVDWLIGIALGFVFVFMLYQLYRLCMKLQSFPTDEPFTHLVGRNVQIYLHLSNDRYLAFVDISGARREVEVISLTSRIYPVNELVSIRKFEDNKLYID